MEKGRDAYLPGALASDDCNNRKVDVNLDANKILSVHDLRLLREHYPVE